MPHEIILKKLNRIEQLLKDLEEILSHSFEEFENNLLFIRTAERDFQLIVDLASDINTQLIIKEGGRTPDTYKETFSGLRRMGILENKLSKKLTETAGLRNILVHEYDFEEDYEKFYRSAKDAIPAYREYIEKVYVHVKQSSKNG